MGKNFPPYKKTVNNSVKLIEPTLNIGDTNKRLYCNRFIDLTITIKFIFTSALVLKFLIIKVSLLYN